MSLVKSIQIETDHPTGSGRRSRQYKITLTDNNLVDHVVVSRPARVDLADIGTTIAAGHLQSMKDNELTSRKLTPDWADSEAEYYRRALGRAMTLQDVDDFYTYLPVFKEMEIRGGANANHRAAYLRITRALYDQITARFNDVEGIAFFLDNAKGQIWDKIPPEFE